MRVIVVPSLTDRSVVEVLNSLSPRLAQSSSRRCTALCRAAMPRSPTGPASRGGRMRARQLAHSGLCSRSSFPESRWSHRRVGLRLAPLRGIRRRRSCRRRAAPPPPAPPGGPPMRRKAASACGKNATCIFVSSFQSSLGAPPRQRFRQAHDSCCMWCETFRSG